MNNNRVILENPFKDITQAHVMNAFTYSDGYLYWKNPYKNAVNIGDKAGSIGITKYKNGTIVYRKKIGFLGVSFFSYRLIFLYHHGYLPPLIDHIDGDSMNDKIENLRAAAPFLNAGNRKMYKKQYKGVSTILNKNQTISYKVVVTANGKIHQMGFFNNIKDAALAYNRGAVKIFGEFANLNIVKPAPRIGFKRYQII